MPEGSIGLLIAIIVLVFMSAFFSATETAFSCANRIRLRTQALNGNKKAAKVLDLAEKNFDTLISTILIGNNIVNITNATLSTLFFAKIITSGNVDSSLISTIVTTVIVLIFGEIMPKQIAKTYPEKFALLIYPVIIAFYYLFYPLNMMFKGLQFVIAKIFRLKPNDVITEEEIMTVVEEAEEDGTIRNDETKLIRSVIEFDDVEVIDVFVPRVNIAAVDIKSSMDKVKNVFLKEGYSRLPVYKNSIDTIVGTIHEKDFFTAYINGDKKVEDILQPAFYTSEHIKISKLLKQLQKNKSHLAVVLDEYGGTLGIITLEDILEELVGEIWDEHDEEIAYLKKIDENVYTAEGNTPLKDFFDQFNAHGEDEKFDASTLSGWIIEYLNEIPITGKKFEYENFSFEVLKATVKRVLKVKVTIKINE